jgi:type II secretory pathway pseudopilin PulG
LHERGFTLIEAILIVVLLSIIAITIATNLGGFSAIKLNAAAKKVASDLRYAQQLSTTKQIIHGIDFSATGYTVYENDNPADPARDPQGGGNFIVNFTSGELAGVTVATTFPANDIVEFNAGGEALQEDGTLLPGGSNSITLSYQGQSRTLTIVPATGKVNY